MFSLNPFSGEVSATAIDELPICSAVLTANPTTPHLTLAKSSSKKIVTDIENTYGRMGSPTGTTKIVAEGAYLCSNPCFNPSGNRDM